jgi:hypothetical protein
MKSISIELTKYKSTLIRFCDWYKSKKFTLDLKTYLTLDFEYQSSILLQFLNENNIHSIFDNDFYIIYSIRSIDKNNKKSIIFIDELYTSESLLNMTKFVILKSFNYLTNPF